MMKFRSVLLAVMFAIGLSPQANAQEPDANTVVATVGGVEITIGHMIAMVTTLTEEQMQLPAETVFKGVMERLIQQEAVSQSKPVPDLMTRLLLENEARSLRASRVVEDLADKIKVTPEAIQEAYNTRFQSFTPATEYNASHILVETQADAIVVLTELSNGADFAALAERKSIGPSGPNGGALGWFGPGRMVKPFEEAVMAMTVGSISAPIETEFGWHIIKLNETRDPAKPSLDELRAEIEQEVWRDTLDREIEAMVDVVRIERRDVSGINPTTIGQLNLIREKP